MDVYNENVDYKVGHILWVRSQGNAFKCSTWTAGNVNDYLLLLDEMYFGCHARIFTNETAKVLWDGDKKSQLKQIMAVVNDNPNNVKMTDDMWITIGFRHESVETDIHQYYKDTAKILKQISEWGCVDTLKAKWEFFRGKEHGFHPHIHMMVKLKSVMYLTTFREKILKIKKLNKYLDVTNKKFVNIAQCLHPEHDMYMAGDKVEEKLENVSLDIDFRHKHNIPEFFEKK